MANNTKSTAIPILAPDGQVYMIPPEQVAEAHLHGGKIALRVEAPSGDQHWIPVDQAVEAQAHGGRFVQNDGSEYPAGQEPVITGANANGQAIWGTGPKYLGRDEAGYPIYQHTPEPPGFLESAGDAIMGAVKGIPALFDPRANEFERTHPAWNTPLAAAGGPLTRLIEPQVQMEQQAEEEARLAAQGGPDAVAHGLEAARHTVGAAVPMVGPWVVGTEDEMAQQAGAGNYAGAAGTAVGNLAVAGATEAAPKVLSAFKEAGKGRLQEMRAKRADLDRPIVPGQLSPMDRWRAANDMGVNLDAAQASTARGATTGGAKTATEKSLFGARHFENNNTANVQALHEQAAKIASDAHPQTMGREQFGSLVHDRLAAHRDALADVPGQTKAAQDLLDSIHLEQQTGEEFGAAAQDALNKHQKHMYTRAAQKLTDALGSKDAKVDLKGVQETADEILDGEFDYYKDNPESLKMPGIRTTLEQILPKASPEMRERWNAQFSPEKAPGQAAFSGDKSAAAPQAPVSSPANVAKLRSDLMNQYRSPDIVGSRAEGWLKQMVESLDNSLTNPRNEEGMSHGQISKFRAGNADWERMKSMYDNPQSPFFSVLRNPETKTVAKTLENLKPVAARQFREAMADLDEQRLAEKPDLKAGDRRQYRSLVDQQQRQFVGHLMDPTDSGSIDLPGFKTRAGKVNQETATELLGSDRLAAVNDLAEKAMRPTVYDKPGALKNILATDADGTKAADAIFTPSTGAMKLTPEEVRTLAQADPDLIPMLRRQAIERQFDPPGNGTVDLRNFATRFNRAEKERLSAVLTPEQANNLDDLAQVSRTVNLPSNPSNTATVLQPATEARNILEGASKGIPALVGSGGAAVGAAAGGPVGAAIGAVAGPIATSLAQGAIAKHLVNPEATAALMEHPEPVPLSTALAKKFPEAAEAVGQLKAGDVAGGVGTAARAAAEGAIKGGMKAAPVAAQAQMPQQQEPDQREGVSTPPGGGVIGDVTRSEPNEVHNPVEEAEVMRQLNPGRAEILPPEPVNQNGGVAALRDSSGKMIYRNSTPGDQTQKPSLTAPAGATHEVLHPDGSVLGHVVDGQYVPLSPTGE
jgi:hypothetical protein